MYKKTVGRLSGALPKCTRIWKKAEFLVSNKKENLANPIERAGFSGFLAPNRHWLSGIEVVSGESVCSNTNKLSILAIDAKVVLKPS